jgi:phosphatidylinositol alpha-mannosyltransferase
MPTSWRGQQLSLPRTTIILHGLTQIQTARTPSSQSTSVPTIAFQGRLVTTKGAGLLLEAAKILCAEGHHFRMVFIGDGPERAKLEAIASQPPLLGRVRFAGRVSAVELERTLADASMVVVPSLGGEVFGLVVAENMRRGLPVIASDLGAFVEVLAEAGKTFPVGNARELAERIAALLKSPELAANLGAQAAQRAEKEFALEGMIAAHAKVYRQVAS